MGAVLSAAGVPFEPHARHFAHDAPDEEWLCFAGERGWPVLARDKNIRYKPNEYVAFLDSGVLGFIFTAGHLSGAETARLTVIAYPNIASLASTIVRPAMFSIDREARIRELRLAKRVERLRQP